MEYNKIIENYEDTIKKNYEEIKLQQREILSLREIISKQQDLIKKYINKNLELNDKFKNN
jgi:hypothetical protein